ncbi:TPA: hypothetical protein SAN82_002606 [Pseudomonas putida]|nr:hypothetical protein [Pseudomonas putida]
MLLTTSPVESIPVGAKLAGEGVLEIAFAGKPGSYKKAISPSILLTLNALL